MLDDGRGRQLELIDQVAAGVQVQQVVEGELATVELRHHGEQVGPCARVRVVGRALVRVLSVGQVEHLLVGARTPEGKALLAVGKPGGDRGVVAGRVGEGFAGKALARAGGQPAPASAQLVEHRVVALGRDHHRRVGVVLGRCADQRRSADVDVLDHLRLGHSAAPGDPLEGIEVHAHQVDRLDPVLVQRVHVPRMRAQGEQTCVDAGVQRLDAPVEDLREAGVVLDRAGLDARFGEVPCRASRWRRSPPRGLSARARSR